MNSDRIRKLALCAGLASLCGCEHVMGEPANAAKFGEPNRMTMMAQVVDPDPQYDGPMAGSAESAAQAAERLRNGTVKKPERVRTGSTTGSGSGGN